MTVNPTHTATAHQLGYKNYLRPMCHHPSSFFNISFSWDMLLVLEGLVKFFSVLFHRETDLEGHLVHYHLDVVQGRYSVIPSKELNGLYILFKEHSPVLD